MTQPRPVAAMLPAASRSLKTSQIGAGPTASTPCDRDELTRRITVLFAAFQAQYANQFDWDYGRDEQKLKAAKKVWYRNALGMVPGPLFEMALRTMGEVCRKIPTLAEFLQLCRPAPELLGLPTVDAAYQEAVVHALDSAHRWSHPAVRLAAKAAGAHDMRLADGWRATQVRRAFETYYGQLVQRVACGEDLAEPTLALGHDGSRPAAQVQEEHAEQQLQARLVQQGLAGRGQGARALLLGKLGIKRERANG